MKKKNSYRIAITLLASFLMSFVSCDDSEKTLNSGNNKKPQDTWTNYIGTQADEIGFDIVETNPLGYFIAGSKEDSLGANNLFVVRTNPFGSIIYTKEIQNEFHETPFAVILSSDNTYLLVGEFKASPSANSDMLIYKLDDSGGIIWSQTYGELENEIGQDIIQTSDKGYLITGSWESSSNGGSDLALLKLDSEGLYEWKKIFGGVNNEYGHSLVGTSDKGFAICGHKESVGAGNSDVYLVKVDSAGTFLWEKSYGGSGNDVGHEIISTKDLGFLIVGESDSFDGGISKAYIIKTDSLGNLIWQKTFPNGKREAAYSVVEVFDGGYVVCGWAIYNLNFGGSDLFLYKLDSQGNMLWDKSYGGGVNDVGYSIIYTADNGFAVAGYTQSFGAGGKDIYFLKTNIAGELRPTTED